MPITNPEEFKCCIGMNMYRTNSTQFPLSPNQYKIQNLRNASISTSEGSYTWNLSAAVSKKERIAAGVYILVPTTFEPGVLAHF